MKVTGDQALIKKLNTSIVLDTIRSNSPISRAQVSELTGLNKATVSNLVNDLIQDNLVHEIGLGQSSGGRKPLLLLFNRMAGYAIGIDIRVNEIVAILTDLEGQIVEELRQSLTNHDYPYVYEQLKIIIQALIKQTPESPYGIVGIGIGVPGMVDENRMILFAPNLEWEQIDLGKQIEAEFGVPVMIDNEANMGAQGELRYGATKDAQNLVYISAGLGLGTGIIIKGDVYKGSSGYSGEMGHMTIEANGRKCSCGNRGCWELYASEKAFLEHSANLPTLQIDELIELANENHTGAIHLFNQIGDYLGIGITNIINTLDPDLIIIGNRISLAERWISSSIGRVITQRTLSYHRKKLQIQFTTLQDRSNVLGAAYIAISLFLGKTRVSQTN